MSKGSKELTLEEYVKRRMYGKGLSRFKAALEVYKEWCDGKLRLTDPNPPRDYIEYLRRLDYSLWYWTTVSLVVLTVITIALSTYVEYLTYLRYVLGSLFVLYLPGASLIEALYPKEEDLSPLERLALSIGLSLAVVPLIGLILNYTPWGIRLEPIITSLTVFTVLMATIATWRKYTQLKYTLS